MWLHGDVEPPGSAVSMSGVDDWIDKSSNFTGLETGVLLIPMITNGFFNKNILDKLTRDTVSILTDAAVNKRVIHFLSHTFFFFVKTLCLHTHNTTNPSTVWWGLLIYGVI